MMSIKLDTFRGRVSQSLHSTFIGYTHSDSAYARKLARVAILAQFLGRVVNPISMQFDVQALSAEAQHI